MIQPSWLNSHDSNSARGLGDTNLDAKWRFFGAAPWSLGMRAGVELPTAEHDLGLPRGKISPHALLVATADIAPLTFDANLGYARLPNGVSRHNDLYHASAAALLASSERLFFVLDTAVDSDPDAAKVRYPAVALLGAIYTARPGLDLDVGFRGSINRDAVAKQWLLGITYRGAL
jgi:hypothetical protein